MAGFFAIKPGWNETTYDYSMKKVFALFGPPIGSTWIFLPYFIPCTVYDNYQYCLSIESFSFATYYVGNIIFWNLATLRIFFWSLPIKSCVWDCTRFWLINILKDKKDPNPALLQKYPAALFTRYHKKYLVKFSQKSKTVSQYTGH